MPQRHILLALLCFASPAFAQDGAPMSAIDWLSQSVVERPGDAREQGNPIDEPPVAQSGLPPNVIVTPLDQIETFSVGLLPSSVTGLPQSLWSASDAETIRDLFAAGVTADLPAQRNFLSVLALADAMPPAGDVTSDGFLVARVDALLELGALEQSLALMDEAGPDTNALFRRYFDAALLIGTEDTACRLMESRQDLAPTYPARIFCLARLGDWAAAALTLNTHRVLGDVTNEEDRLLSRFLDPELAEEEDLLPPPKVTPLVFRMREAIGEALPTARLPIAFSHADLRDTTGWKAQLEAAERLARTGALDPNALQALYTSRTPSASGGIWDRVDSFQRFDIAMRARDPNAVARTLPAVWDAMKTIRSEVAFAELYGAQLNELNLPDQAQELAFEIGLLSDQYESIASTTSGGDPFLKALAQGSPQDIRAVEPEELAVQAAFNGTRPPEALTTLVQDGKLGEAILRAMATFKAGVSGDRRAVTEALALFRSVGLEDLARKSALQLLILERA